MIGALAAAGLLVLVLTPTVAVVVLWRYRRAVQRSMMRPADTPAPVVVAPPPEALPRPPVGSPLLPELRWEVYGHDTGRPEPGSEAGRLLSRIRTALGQAAIVHLAAGVVYALVAATVMLTAGGLEARPVRFAAVAVALAWPLLPTLVIVRGLTRRGQWAAATAYTLLLVTVGLTAGGGAGEMLLFIGIIVGPGALLMIALTHRRVRAVAPLVAPGILLGSLALVATPWLAWPLVAVGAPVAGSLVAVGTLSLIAGLAAIFGYLRWVARRYERKRSSDRSLLLSAWWLLAASALGLLLAPDGLQWLMLALVPFGLHQAVVHVGTRVATRRADADENVRLLLLRAFGGRGRSEELLGRVSRVWRCVGNVQMIAGADLAAANLEPHEFLLFVRGALARRFVTGQRDLTQRFLERDLQRDPDGRYRVEEFFCHDDTWRLTVQQLIGDSDVILMDLRGFTEANRGVRYELATLVELVWLERVVLVVDAGTDMAMVESTIWDAWQHMSSTARNRLFGRTTLRMLRVDGALHFADDVLLRALCSAARPEAAGHRCAPGDGERPLPVTTDGSAD